MLDKIFPKIHSEGYKFLAIAIIATFFLYLFSTFLGLIGLYYLYGFIIFLETLKEFQSMMKIT